MAELRSLGRDFFVPFFQMLWDFLDTTFLFGITFKQFLLGVFAISLSINLLTMIFGIGGGGARAVKTYADKHRKKGGPSGYSSTTFGE